MEVTKPDGQAGDATFELTGQPDKLAGQARRGDKSTKLISPELDELQLTASFKGEPLGYDGIVQLSATVSAAANGRRRRPTAASSPWLGIVVWADGQRTRLHGQTHRRARSPTKDEKATTTKADKQATSPTRTDGEKEAEEPKPTTTKTKTPDDKDDQTAQGARPRRSARELSARSLRPRGAARAAASSSCFADATVWTSGPQGRLEKADVLVEAGKINAVGSGLADARRGDW